MVYQNLYKFYLLDLLHKHGNFQDACEAAKISQSAFSQNMTSLEKKLEKTLFVRNKGTVTFTEAGITIVYQLRKHIEELGALQLFERANGNVQKLGKISFGSYESMAVNLLPKFIHSLRLKFPDLKLDLTTDRSAKLLQLVQKGELEYALVVNPEEKSSIEIHELGKSTLGIFAAKNSPAAALSLSDGLLQIGLAGLAWNLGCDRLQTITADLSVVFLTR